MSYMDPKTRGKYSSNQVMAAQSHTKVDEDQRDGAEHLREQERDLHRDIFREKSLTVLRPM